MARLQKTELKPQIRWLIRRDMDEVLEIENRSFEFPWTDSDFLVCLKQRNCIGTVYESSQQLIHGFMLYELHKDRLRILNMAVAHEVRRTGVGRAMVQRLMDKLSHQRRHTIEAEVRETNVVAQSFLSGAGFRAVKVLRKHYDDTNEDAYLFRHTLPVNEMQFVRNGSNRISEYCE